MVLKCLIYLSNKQIECLEQFQWRKEKKNAIASKSHVEVLLSKGKTVKASGQSCNIYTPYKAYI